MPEIVAADARAWAEKHGIVLSVTPLTDRTWRVEAKTCNGTLGADIDTDGSWTPDPFECLFGVWADITPGHHEYQRAGKILGPAALAGLARLLDWL